MAGRVWERRVTGRCWVGVWSGQVKAGQLQLQQDEDNCRDCGELVVIDFNNGKCENANSEINILCDEQPAVVVISDDDSSIFQQINENTKLEVEASSEDLDCGTSMHADTESSLDSRTA